MTEVTPAVVRELVIARVEDSLQAIGVSPAEVSDEFDLLTAGVIDSFGIIEMIAAVEDRFNCELDFEELDPEDLTVVGPFCSFVAKRVNALAQAA